MSQLRIEKIQELMKQEISQIILQELKDLDERRETVDAARFRVEVDEFGRLARVFAHAFEVPMMNNARDEAFFVLEFHRVESATVGVDPNEKIMGFGKIARHCISL